MFLKELDFSLLLANLAIVAQGNIFIAVYVNDMLIVRLSITKIEAIKQALGTWFNISNLKQCHVYLEMSIHQNKSQWTLFLSQRGIIKQTLHDFGIGDAKPVITPIDTNKLKLPKEKYTFSASKR